MKRILLTVLFLFLGLATLEAIPGEIIRYIRSTPVVSFESLSLEKFFLLKKFSIEELTAKSQEIGTDYFLHRNRSVFLSPSKKWVVKIWEELYPSAKLFEEAFQEGFFDDISKVEGIIYDKNGRCRGYITPYMISRNNNRAEWEKSGLQLEKNSIHVSIFSNVEKQPLAYKNLFDLLVFKTKQTGLFITDFCPNNLVINSENNRLYLIDLEDIERKETISSNDPRMQMRLSFNPRDYLTIFGLYKNI